MGLHVIIPGEKKLVCRLCKKEFYERDMREYKAHGVKCSGQNADNIEAARLAKQPFFDAEKLGTKDIEDWLDRDDNRQKVIEKRKKM